MMWDVFRILLTIFTKCPILEIRQGSEYASVINITSSRCLYLIVTFCCLLTYILYHKMIECETFIEVYLLLNWRTKSLQRQAINWQKSCSVELLRFSLKLFKILKITLVLKSHFKKEIGRPAHFLYSGTGNFVWVLQKF